jgi:Flp pilus assembly protein TadG
VRLRSERGAVTAELVVALPVLLAVTLALVWMIGLGVGQVRVVDGAREGARALARGDDLETARSLAAEVAGAGATVRLGRTEGQVAVTVERVVTGPGGLLGRLSGVRLRATAVTAPEQPP